MAEQGILPTLDGPALVAGPVFFEMELLGKPGHKARHRSRIAWKDGKPYVHQYADPDTAAYEAVLARAGALFMRGRPPTTLPVALLVHAFLAVPESWSNRDRTAALFGAITPTGRPDGDNFLKACQDGLNKIVWHDDSQIIDSRIIKRYHARPALRIEVREFVAEALVR